MHLSILAQPHLTKFSLSLICILLVVEELWGSDPPNTSKSWFALHELDLTDLSFKVWSLNLRNFVHCHLVVSLSKCCRLLLQLLRPNIFLKFGAYERTGMRPVVLRTDRIKCEHLWFISLSSRWCLLPLFIPDPLLIHLVYR